MFTLVDFRENKIEQLCQKIDLKISFFSSSEQASLPKIITWSVCNIYLPLSLTEPMKWNIVILDYVYSEVFKRNFNHGT